MEFLFFDKLYFPTTGMTRQPYDLELPENDALLDALSLLEIHVDEARQGMEDANSGLAKLFPYFFLKKEEPKTFGELAKCFNVEEDLGHNLRQEGLKVGVEGTIALVANSQQNDELGQGWRRAENGDGDMGVFDQGRQA